ncbi:MAG: serine/threonine-protein kinase, partial [Bradymonadaceae bacterium]
MSVDANIYCGPFELLEPRGAGSVAVVWRARHRTHGVPAAVKVIDTEKARNAEYQERFRREVRSHARLNHPAIATVFDYGEIDGEAAVASEGELVAGSPYLAMEYTEGGTVGRDHRVRNWFHLRSILLQVLDGLAHAHARGVIHRDLKPANIMLAPSSGDETIAILIDFGIVQFSEDGSQTVGFVGTPMYSSPEQARFEDVDFRSDLYSFGMVLFHMLAGRPAFTHRNVTRLLSAHDSDPIPRLEEVAP